MTHCSHIVTPINAWGKVFATPSTASEPLSAPSAFTSDPLLTSGVIRPAQGNRIAMAFEIADAAGLQAIVQVLGISPIVGEDWSVSLPINQFTVTAGTTGTGVSGFYYADLLTRDAGQEDILKLNVVSGGTFENYINAWSIPRRGFEYLWFRVDTIDAASVNVLYQIL